MPTGFRWIVPARLAGSGQPGLLRPLEEDLDFLRAAGIRVVVTLTEAPLCASAGGLRLVHFPIPDMGIPTPRAAERICREVVASLGREEPVLIHCKAGLGRTGTVLACCLVSLGRGAAEALAEVRRANVGYVQGPAQERFIAHYGAYLAGLRAGARSP